MKNYQYFLTFFIFKIIITFMDLTEIKNNFDDFISKNSLLIAFVLFVNELLARGEQDTLSEVSQELAEIIEKFEKKINEHNEQIENMLKFMTNIESIVEKLSDEEIEGFTFIVC